MTDDDKYKGALDYFAEAIALRQAEADQLTAKGIVSICLADVEPERVEWLWSGRLPLGKLVVLDGDPDIGKSTLTLDLTARVTTGSPMPDGERLLDIPGDVILMSAEDGLADTIRPRLDAAGGNPARVHTFDAVMVPPDPDDPTGEWTKRAPSIPADLGRLRDLIIYHRACLTIVDVLNAYLSTKVDSYRDHDMRSALMPLADLADETRSVVIVLRHLNKSGGANPLYRGGGSIGIIGAARVGLLAGFDPADDTRRVLAVTKSNLATKPSALAYRIFEDPEWQCAKLTWEGPVDLKAADLLGGLPADDDSVDAASALAEILADGPVWMKDAVDAMKAAGFSKDQAKRAKTKIGAMSLKVGKPSDAKQGWQWTLLSPRREHSSDLSEHEGRKGAKEGESIALLSSGDLDDPQDPNRAKGYSPLPLLPSPPSEEFAPFGDNGNQPDNDNDPPF